MSDNLTPSEVTAILSGTEPSAKRYMILRDGTRAKYDAEAIGGFEGRQGTIKRSRKGRSVIQPNGRRYYIAANPSVEVPTEVIAYRSR